MGKKWDGIMGKDGIGWGSALGVTKFFQGLSAQISKRNKQEIWWS